jgi:hypothetical protein
MKKVSKYAAYDPGDNLIKHVFRSGTTFGTPLTSRASTKTGRRQSQRGTTFGTSKQKRLAMVDGRSALSNAVWLASHLA